MNVALAALSGEEQGVVLDPHIAVALSSVSNELRLATQARKQLKTDYEAAAALCRNVGMSCKQLREARVVYWYSHRGRPGVAGHAGIGAASRSRS